MRGPIVVYRFVGETFGICWRAAVNKKNKLAYLENCSNKNFGRKVTMLYFAVDTWLLTYLFALFAGGLLRCIILGPRVEGSDFPRPNPNLKEPMSNFLLVCFDVSWPAESTLSRAPASVRGRYISEYSGPIPSML